MKRRIAIILLLLIGGAIGNVAVAWGIGIRPFMGGAYVPTHPKDVAWWHARAPPSFSVDPDDHKGRRVTVHTTYEQMSHSIDMGSGNRFAINNVWRWRVGMPLRSMEGSRWRGEDLIERGQDRMVLHDPIFATAWRLPMRPLWPGFVVNSLFYAVILWLLLGGLAAERTRLRCRRGLCAKCAYPIGVSPVCTECGAAVARKGHA